MTAFPSLPRLWRTSGVRASGLEGIRQCHALVVAAAVFVTLLPSTAATTAPVTIAARARAIRPGELVVFTITTPSPADSVSVRAFDRTTPAFNVDRLTWRALVGIDLDVRPAVYRAQAIVEMDHSRTETPYTLTVRPRRFTTRTLHVDEAFVHPPPEMHDRIERDRELIARVYAAPAPTRLWSDAFVAPVPGTTVSSFGRRSIFNGVPLNPHSGTDFLSPAGTPIAAPNAGRIVVAEDLYYSGNTVMIDHGLGLFSLLAHLSKIDVREGDAVARGQIVGLVGATGRVTGPHLHWAVHASGARVDPLSVLALLGQERR